MATATHDVGRKLDALPLGRFHYRLTGLIVGGLFVDQFDNYITGGVLGAAIKEGWSTMSMNALFISAGTAGMTIGSIAAGWLGDRYGRRFSFQLNLLIFGLFSFAAAASPTMGWLTVSRFLMGLGMGAEFVIAYTMLSEFVPPQSRGRWQASMAVISNGAVFISSLCGFLIIPHYGWRWVFVIAGIAALVVWVLRKTLPESPRWLESQGRNAEAEKVVDDIVHELGLKEAPAVAPSATPTTVTADVPFMVLFSPPVIRSLADPAKTYAVNVGGTVNVFEAARRANIAKVLLISSNAAYHRKERDAFDETHPTTSLYSGNPNAHYGASKMAAEQVALAYHTFHGIDALAIRITSVYGFGMKPGQMQLKQIVEGAANGQAVEIASGGHVVRDYTYVGDSAAGIVAILNADTRAVSQRIFNISRGELTSTFDIAEAARAAFPDADIEVSGEMTEFEKATLKQRAPLSWAAAEKVFGYRPRYSLRDGIKSYADLYTAFKTHPLAST